jgi:alkylation response protein AidB-like acyl-CoA dehydrogenase
MTMINDEAAFQQLAGEIEAFVRGPGEEYAAQIERDHAVPSRLWEDLRGRGYLSLAAPAEYGGRGIPFSRYLQLIELFSMSHASLRMIVHVCNGIWRAIDRFATSEQRKTFVLPQICGDIRVAFTLTEPTAGTGADLRCSVTREGDTYYLSGAKHLITFGCSCDYWLLFARVAGTHGADGTMALMVDRGAPGVTVDPMPDSMGVASAGREPAW